MQPELALILADGSLLELQNFVAIPVEQGIQGRIVGIVFQSQQGAQKGKIHRGHIISDAVCLDAVASEQGIHRILSGLGESGIDIQ